MSTDETMFFYTDGLLSKWGFHDGDMLGDFLFDHDITVDEHRVLHRVVCEHVLPYLDQDVEVTVIGTIHNPVRAVKVDGVEVTGAVWYGEKEGPTLTPSIVEVPHSDVLACAVAEAT